MERAAYNTRAWRALPRDRCIVSVLFGDAAGPCQGLIHRHHVDPDDPRSRSVPCCASHHPKLQAALRFLLRTPRRRVCRHRHMTLAAREQCERRLNRQAAA